MIYTQLNAEFQRIAKRDKKSLNEQCKEIEEKIELERLEIPSRNLEISREHFMQGFNSIQFNRSVVSDSLQPHEPQHARPPCPSLTPRVHLNPCPLNR